MDVYEWRRSGKSTPILYTLVIWPGRLAQPGFAIKEAKFQIIFHKRIEVLIFQKNEVPSSSFSKSTWLLSLSISIFLSQKTLPQFDHYFKGSGFLGILVCTI